MLRGLCNLTPSSCPEFGSDRVTGRNVSSLAPNPTLQLRWVHGIVFILLPFTLKGREWNHRLKRPWSPINGTEQVRVSAAHFLPVCGIQLCGQAAELASLPGQSSGDECLVYEITGLGGSLTLLSSEKLGVLRSKGWSPEEWASTFCLRPTTFPLSQPCALLAIGAEVSGP